MALNVVRSNTPWQPRDAVGVITGHGVPDLDRGRPYELYLDRDGKRLYQKGAAGWTDLGLVKGDRGWVPVLALKADGARRVHQIVDYFGGEGDKPAAGKYVGEDGPVASIDDAMDIRGPEGPEMLISALTSASSAASYHTLVAVADEGGDNRSRPLQGLLSAGGHLPIQTFEDGRSTAFLPVIKTLCVLAATDDEGGPGVIMERAAGEPASGPKFRSADLYNASGVIDAIHGGWWRKKPGIPASPRNTAPFNATEFDGISADGSEDVSSAVSALLARAAGDKIYFPKGIFRFDQPVSCSGVINIEGAGNGAGPGLITRQNATVFVANFPNPVLLKSTSLFPSHVTKVQFTVDVRYDDVESGHALSLEGDVGNQNNSEIMHCAFDGFLTPVFMLRPSYPRIVHNYFQNWKMDAIEMYTDGTREGSAGFIRNNHFFGSTTQRSCLRSNCGYLIFAENETLGGQWGVDVDVSKYPAGFVKIINNTIENQKYGGVRGNASDTQNSAMWDVSHNEFSNASFPDDYQSSILIGDSAGRNWIDDIQIALNTMRHSGNPDLGYVRVAAGRGIKVFGNTLENIGPVAHDFGIVIDSISGGGFGDHTPEVSDNTFLGSFNARYAFSAARPVRLRDMDPMAYARIPTNCASGSQVMVSDGRATNWAAQNLTLTAGGTSGGALAIRNASIWTCASPS